MLVNRILFNQPYYLRWRSRRGCRIPGNFLHERLLMESFAGDDIPFSRS
ncbi:MAG: hypothetical protein PHY82_04850 [Lentisphaeria bacterium]|nr:hypothetical protein [Lentisphaeria bacterium]